MSLFTIHKNCLTERYSIGNMSQYALQFSCSVVSDSLLPHGLQHTRLLCPLTTPRAYSNLLIHQVGDAIQQSHPLCPLLLLPSIFPSIRVFSNESVLCIRWPKYGLSWLLNTKLFYSFLGIGRSKSTHTCT